MSLQGMSIIAENPTTIVDLPIQNDIIDIESRQFKNFFKGENKLIEKALIDHINEVDHEECEPGDEDSFFVCDLNQVYNSVQLWKQQLPRVQAHYAVKCNTNMKVVEFLAEKGVNFDCASKNEIDAVLQLGVAAERIVYANPCKTNSFIRHARDNQVNLTTVDNVNELVKLSKFHPECGILVRIITDDESSQCRLSTKFGCSVETAVKEILPTAKNLGLPVVGVAFHVGSGAKDFQAIYQAIRDSRIVFDYGIDLGFKMKILDIGGGFEFDTFVESSKMVNVSIDKFFPDLFVKENGISFIAEPGRFMVANAFTLATHVIAKRDINGSAKAMLYINDGVYGNLNCILFDHQEPTARILKSGGQFHYGEKDRRRFEYSIWGPTCDGLDCVSASSHLNCNVAVGDWLYFPNLGAYTSCAKTQFNGFKNDTEVIYIPVQE